MKQYEQFCSILCFKTFLGPFSISCISKNPLHSSWSSACSLLLLLLFDSIIIKVQIVRKPFSSIVCYIPKSTNGFIIFDDLKQGSFNLWGMEQPWHQ